MLTLLTGEPLSARLYLASVLFTKELGRLLSVSLEVISAIMLLILRVLRVPHCSLPMHVLTWSLSNLLVEQVIQVVFITGL